MGVFDVTEHPTQCTYCTRPGVIMEPLYWDGPDRVFCQEHYDGFMRVRASTTQGQMPDLAFVKAVRDPALRYCEAEDCAAVTYRVDPAPGWLIWNNDAWCTEHAADTPVRGQGSF